jgi:hypothetical protein
MHAIVNTLPTYIHPYMHLYMCTYLLQCFHLFVLCECVCVWISKSKQFVMVYLNMYIHCGIHTQARLVCTCHKSHCVWVVCMYVCMYVFMYVCMYFVYLCMCNMVRASSPQALSSLPATQCLCQAELYTCCVCKKRSLLLVKMKEKKLLKIQSLPKVLRMQAIRATTSVCMCNKAHCVWVGRRRSRPKKKSRFEPFENCVFRVAQKWLNGIFPSPHNFAANSDAISFIYTCLLFSVHVIWYTYIHICLYVYPHVFHSSHSCGMHIYTFRVCVSVLFSTHTTCVFLGSIKFNTRQLSSINWY